MNLTAEIRAAGSKPHKLEQLYEKAQKEGQTDVFQTAILASYEEDPDNLLFEAWFYRLQKTAETEVKSQREVNWVLAVPLSILTGLIFWLLSDIESLIYLDHLPHLALWWSPIATMSALIFMAFTAKSNQVRGVVLGLGLLAAAAYAMLVAPGLEAPWKINHYLDLAAIHIPLLCWIALGISVLGFKSSKEDRFAFMIKSIEVMITACLYLIAGMVFVGITVGMFEALNIRLPEVWLRFLVAGGFGLIPVLAVASVYDPKTSPSKQDFDQGLSKFIATMMRLLLPLTLGVLAIYILVIPFNFLEPYNNRDVLIVIPFNFLELYNNRDVLIVYNLMLFAIIGLLLGATPISGADLSPKLQNRLRMGIIIVAILAALVSIYALSATIFRTFEGGWTINRLTIIGWNIINISLLFWLIFKQFKSGQEKWIDSLHSVFSQASVPYLVWGLFIVLVIPWLFR
jgi:hypothetical protein